MNGKVIRSHESKGLALRLLGGFVAGGGLGLLLAIGLVFGVLPESFFGRGEERGARMLVLILWGIPLTTLLGSVAGLAISYRLRGSRLAAWGILAVCSILAVIALVISLSTWNRIQHWLEGN